MTSEEALEQLGLTLPFSRKLSCPKHSDTEPSLHVYPGDKGAYCFACNEGGDGWWLLSWFTGTPISQLKRDAGINPNAPRARSRWQIIADIQAEARSMTYDYHHNAMTIAHGRDYEMWRATYGGKDRASLKVPSLVEETAHRAESLYPNLFAKEVDEEVSPRELERDLDGLRQLYEASISDQLALEELARSDA